MAGGALLVASVIPCILRCVNTKESSGKENEGHAQELRKQGKNSNDTKPIVGDHTLFISTV